MSCASLPYMSIHLWLVFFALSYADADRKNTFDVDRFLTATRRKRQQVVTQGEIFDLYEIDLSDEDAAAE